jgi:aromatic ring hydroxylase
MAMMTGEQYRQSLVDGRQCYLDGELIKDPSEHPLLKPAVDSVAATYDRFYDPAPDAFHRCTRSRSLVRTWDRRIAALGQSDITAGTTPRAWRSSRSRRSSAS